MTAEPERTCVGCRTKGPRSNLLRVVLDTSTVPAALVPDAASRLPGRGAWVHPTAACVNRAIGRRAFARALRHTGGVDAAALVAAVAGASEG
ncbi:MAG: YlxR family protein [Bifidobacteriaceae bacterium]|jgi:predicted RNA-binding protein YlxR (DUF448 family)|nr:YlxR family protein [Bifidobacteriaceae bacterium]